MIEIIADRHNLEDYFECVESLMNDGTKSDYKTALSKVLFRSNNYLVYVYIRYGRIIATGSIMFEHKIRYDEPKGYIEDIAVHPKYRGKGYGKKMVEHLISCCKKRNCYKIVLTCTDDLIDYYKSLGFNKDVNFMVQ
jgi:GNAT superfamily N-acetyltransferase